MKQFILCLLIMAFSLPMITAEPVFINYNGTWGYFIPENEFEYMEYHFTTSTSKITQRKGDTLVLNSYSIEWGEPDEDGRRPLNKVENSDIEIPVDAIVIAVGQSVDFDLIDAATDNKIEKERNKITVNEMTFETNITKMFGIKHPIFSAAMGPFYTTDLCVAVSEAGGLGVLSHITIHGTISIDEMKKSMEYVVEHTDKPFGFNIRTARLQPDAIKLCRQLPRFIMANPKIKEQCVYLITSAGSPRMIYNKHFEIV